MIRKILGAAGFTFAIAYFIYGHAEYTNIGVAEIPSQIFMGILAALGGALYPTIEKTAPLVYNYFSNDDVLEILTDLEIKVNDSDPEVREAFNKLRDLIIKRRTK